MSARQILHNMLEHSDLSFHDFVEVALYHPEHGYYSQGRSPVGREGDFVTSPVLSPVFSFTLGRLVREFLSHYTDEVCSIVDIGCGDGSLIRELANAPHPAFGHPLPAQRGEGQPEGQSTHGQPTEGQPMPVALLPAGGEKVPEGRMRGVDQGLRFEVRRSKFE